MTLRITIGSNEKNIVEGENLILYTLFNGQQSYDFYLSENNQTTRKHFRISLPSPKEVSERFTQLTFRNTGSIFTVEVSMEGHAVTPIPDVVNFFQEAAKSAETDPRYYWKMLGLSESIINDESIDAAAAYLEKTYRSYPDIPPIIHDAADRKIRKIRDSYGSVILYLDLEDMELFIDGQKTGTLGTALALTAGNHRVELKKGTTTVTTEIVPVEARSSTTIRLPLGKKPAWSLESFGNASDAISLALFLLVAILPVLAFQAGILGMILLAILGGIALLGLSKQKKWGFILLGLAYVALLTQGGYVTGVSLLALAGTGFVYWNHARSWELK